MKCENCKYWGDSGDKEYYLNLGICKRIIEFDKALDWDVIDDKGRIFKKEFENDLAFTQDPNDYQSWLLTKPDFWCKLHEQK